MTIADSSDTRARKELEQAYKELEAFSYSVSHDLRAPLRSIDGFSQALLEDYADKLDAQGKDFLRRVRAASQHMAQLIDDLLKLSRITRTEMRYEQVDLTAIARKISAELKEMEPDRSVDFIIGEGITAYGDASLLRVVLVNLLNNAWKFTEKHPHATIEFGTRQEEGQRIYFVRDDGAGFDMAYVNKLFAPFQRLHVSTEFEGTGIGLATIQRIIHRHGGSVWAEGKVEKGATFSFTLRSTE
jgi:light-regulated signal transduction histidine kinase (bacteriophytochrome)